MDENRLATADRDGQRIYLYPEAVVGFWNRWRTLVYCVLIAIYLSLPWLKINGRQAILADLQRGEFFIFGGHYYSHNIPLVFIVVITFVVLIGLVTALAGRIWCGWGCPQTVFIEGIFRKIEEWIEGHHRKRMHLDQGPWTLEKGIKKIVKWWLFALASLVISHSFLAYFVPVEELFGIVRHSPRENMSLFVAMLVTTGVVLFDFGWFREQFCIIACPYGRFQSVLMDQDSLVVAYDMNRGEPRKRGLPGEKHGDCINCYKCVHVCPTGIDIRRGTQLECIHCTRCIDACDKIMDRIKKPRGLIRYSTERNLVGKNSTKLLRPQVIVYGIILLFLFGVGGVFFRQSTKLEALFLRGTRAPYQIVFKENRQFVVNHYKAELFYRGEKELRLDFQVDHPMVEVVSPVKNITLEASRKKVIHLFFRFPKGALPGGGQKIQVSIFHSGEELFKKEISLLAPY